MIRETIYKIKRKLGLIKEPSNNMVDVIFSVTLVPKNKLHKTITKQTKRKARK